MNLDTYTCLCGVKPLAVMRVDAHDRLMHDLRKQVERMEAEHAEALRSAHPKQDCACEAWQATADDWKARADALELALKNLVIRVTANGNHCLGAHPCAMRSTNPLVKEMVAEGHTCLYCDQNAALAWAEAVMKSENGNPLC